MFIATLRLSSLLPIVGWLSLTSCAEFPSFPRIPIKDIGVEADMTEVRVMDMEAVEMGGEDIGPVDMAVVEMGPIEMGLVDMEMEDMGPMEEDMEIPVANFVLTQCQNGEITGSEERYEAGVRVTLTPLRCEVEGESFLRVDPVESVGFSTNDFINPETGDPLTSVTTDYTYFFMTREVPYRKYNEVCTAVEMPQEPSDRVSEGSCLSPEALIARVTSPAYCSHIKQGEYDNSSEGMMATGVERDLPMNCVDWESAANFCRRLGGRLPSEAEWELAATYGRENFPFSWPASVEDRCPYANIREIDESCQESNPLVTSTATQMAERLAIRPSCWGDQNPWREAEAESALCDVIGNLAEWMLDDMRDQDMTDYSNATPFAEGPDNLLACPTSGTMKKVLRGGSANSGGSRRNINEFLSMYSREEGLCTAVDQYVGFRCVISAQSHGVLEYQGEP